MVTADPVLCYVSGQWAFFTTQSLDKQWGDDWDDAPYEHNAGWPYGPHSEKDGHWEIVRIAFDGPLVTPDDAVSNSTYSVRDINNRAVAWLRDRWSGSGVVIHAGTPLSEFKALVRKSGGTVWVKEQP